MEGFWGIVVVVGPILLIGAIIYATLRNRKANAASERRADIGAKRLREDIEEQPNKQADL
ncbi:hypothetical protein [Qipengyuania spongiae]|uniref:Uncharacterized protein n=1 Tax=Qipengyuania spongiae TaxID=2909673 RepID=A0ABY5SZL8_9SPHN|nr:hypothetical protein [Qipengyuania spongiae]UVI39704.1 hypothetical protein L1F33_01715 [Qipengyuania spongiae]